MNKPPDNFSKGLYRIDIPELGDPIRGKIRDNWVVPQGKSKLRVMVTTDRQPAFVRDVCTIPGKGQISNLISAFWFDTTKDIVQNHVVAIPHRNVLIAKQAVAVVPIEVVVRRYMAAGITPTSVYVNYVEKGRRKIYGIHFPDNLRPNQEFPMGTILTPTTKAKDGHDKELTETEARSITDRAFGDGTWKKVSSAAHAIFERARVYCLQKGIILVDTKFEFGIDENGDVMLIDEVLSPDGSRFWRKDTYEESFNNGMAPAFDRNILVKWLQEKGFDGTGNVPLIDTGIIDQMLAVYAEPYRMITGNDVPIPETNPNAIKQAVLDYLKIDHAYE